MNLQQRYRAAMNRIAKWRMVFASWQCGTRAKGDPESEAVKEHREATIIMRIEINALTALLQSKGVITDVEMAEQCITEVRFQNEQLEKFFPGFSVNDVGVSMQMPEAAETAKRFAP